MASMTEIVQMEETREQTEGGACKLEASDVHNQANRCRSMIDFCLESRDTRLCEESVCLPRGDDNPQTYQ